MAQISQISWTHATFNPWIGCTKVSPACQHCYAATLDSNRYSKTCKGASKENPISHWGRGAPRLRTSAANWRNPLKWNRAPYVCELCDERYSEQVECMCSGQRVRTVRTRVFCASLADWLDDEVPIEWLADLLALIHATPNLDWLLLTKRPGIWRARIEAVLSEQREKSGDTPSPFSDWLVEWLICGLRPIGRAPTNVWIGCTVEDQQRANERIPLLLGIPARVRFLSCEPLLGELDLCIHTGMGRWFSPLTGEREFSSSRDHDGGRVHWVICGGESGPGARPMHPEWARSLRDQCSAAGVAFHFKQWGEWMPVAHDGIASGGERLLETEVRGAMVPAWMLRAGKKAAGRLLDGRTWDAFPNAAALRNP